MSGPFGLYVHVPFCARACPYCDFDISVTRRPDVPAYLNALERELDERVDTRAGDAPHTIYVGGGTPSVLDADALAALMTLLAARWDVTRCAEWTVECNPEHVDSQRLDALERAGVGRISLGVQSFTAPGLYQLGRAHSAAQAREAIALALRRGFEVSADLIVGWPGQEVSGLEDELEVLLATGCAHVSIYGLTIEPGTPWVRLAERGVRRLPQASQSAVLLLAAERRLCAAGFEHYEIASYAADDRLATHNCGYWEGRDYVGVGPSAASATFSENHVLRRSNARGKAWWAGESATSEHLEGEAWAREALWLALRRLDGVKLDPLLDRLQRSRAWLMERVARPVRRGNLVIEGEWLRVAPQRWLHHDDIGVDVL